MNAATQAGVRTRQTDITSGPRTPVTQPAADVHPTSRPTGRAVREEILHRAYALWEAEGFPEGRKLDHWLAAEAEVLAGAHPNEHTD